jgi:hypothetical protein
MDRNKARAIYIWTKACKHKEINPEKKLQLAIYWDS